MRIRLIIPYPTGKATISCNTPTAVSTFGMSFISIERLPFCSRKSQRRVYFIHIIDHFAKCLTLIERTLRVGNEKQGHPAGLKKNLLSTQPAASRRSGTIRNSSSVSGGTGPKRSSSRERKASTSLSNVNPSNSRYKACVHCYR